MSLLELPRTSVLDLRGRRDHAAAPPVLADPSGRRARHFRRVGRGIAALLITWSCGLTLASIGVIPARIVPLAGVLLPTLHLSGAGEHGGSTHRPDIEALSAPQATFIGPRRTATSASRRPASSPGIDGAANRRRDIVRPGARDRDVIGRAPTAPVAAAAPIVASTESPVGTGSTSSKAPSALDGGAVTAAGGGGAPSGGTSSSTTSAGSDVPERNRGQVNASANANPASNGAGNGASAKANGAANASANAAAGGAKADGATPANAASAGGGQAPASRGNSGGDAAPSKTSDAGNAAANGNPATGNGANGNAAANGNGASDNAAANGNGANGNAAAGRASEGRASGSNGASTHH